MSDDLKARAAYEKGLALKEAGQFTEAVKALTSFRTRSFTNYHKLCFSMLVNICLCQEKGAHSDSLAAALRDIKRVLHGSQQQEDEMKQVVSVIFANMREMCTTAQEMYKSMLQTPSDNDNILVALSGVPLPHRARERYLTPCERAVMRIGGILLDGRIITLSPKLIPLFSSTATDMFALCKEFGLTDALNGAAVNILKASSRALIDPIPPQSNVEGQEGRNAMLLETLNNRAAFYKSQTNTLNTILMLSSLIRLQAQMKEWRKLWHALSFLKTLSDAILEFRGPEEQRVQVYMAMSDVFLSCDKMNFHALSLAVAAPHIAPNSAIFATRTVLAALCAHDSAYESNAFSPAHYDNATADIAALMDSATATREGIISRVELDGITAYADGDAVSLLRALGTNAIIDPASLHATVTAIIKKDASYAVYETPLRNTILLHQLKHLSTQSDRISLDDLAVNGKELPVEEYIRVIEPSLVDDNTVPVEIDSKARTVTFRNSTKSKTLAAFKKLSAHVDVHPAKSFVPSRVACSSVGVTEPRAITFSDLTASHTRALHMRELQTACGGTVNERKADKEKRIDEARQAKVNERKAAEEERREMARKKQMEKLYAEYYERQRQERNKLLLSKLRIKYPGLKLDNSIATKNASAFEEELALTLAAFKRKGSEGERREVLKGNLFERELRRREIPKRREEDAKNADKHREERAIARANTLAQHRQEFDKRQQEKVALQKFLMDAAEFEDQWRKIGTTKEKASKRDAQQSLLEQEMQRLAAGE